MKAVRILGHGGPEVLRLDEVPDSPAPGPGEARVHVRATGLNRADFLQARGLYPAPPGVPADIPGLEFSGEVVEVGQGVSSWQAGDKVMGLVAGGAFAELLTTRADALLPVPSCVELAHAAAIPEAFFTAYDALRLQGGLTQGQHVLVHAVASGVGTAAVQVCHAFGAEALGTTRSPWKLQRCQTLTGLRIGRVCTEPSPTFADWVLDITEGRGAELALELVSGPYLAETIRSLAPQGQVLLVGLLGGSRSEIDVGRLLARQIRLQGTTLRSRAPAKKAALTEAFALELLPHFESGALRPIVSDVLPVADIQRAVASLGANEFVGKLVLAW